MKYSSILIGILLLGIFQSCSRERKIYTDATLISYDDFAEIQKLNAEAIIGLDSLILAPTHLRVYDSILIVINKRADKRIQLLNLNTKKQIAAHISVGQGPNEMLIPRFVGNDEENIFISDLVKSIVSKYNMNDFLKSEEPEFIERLSLEKQVSGEVRLLNDGLIGTVSYNPSFYLYKFNKAGRVIDSIGHYPVINMDVTDSEMFNMYSFGFTTNQKDKIAVCYNWTDLIDIYDKDGHLCNRIHGPRYFVSEYKEFRDGKVVSSSRVKGQTRDAYFSPVSIGDEFWVLFSGKSESEEGYGILSEQIFVFGWDGTPRKIIELDKGIFAFTVNEKKKKIYGISNSPDYHILSFSY